MIALLMVTVIACIALWNLPPGRPRDRARTVVGPVVLAIGLEQDWALFAPDPRRFGVGVYATVTHRGGRTERWVPPHNGLFLSPYRTYRWQKYVERLRADDYRSLWEPTARWIAEDAGPGVTTVELVRTFREAVVPGSGKPRPAQGEFSFYTLTLP